VVTCHGTLNGSTCGGSGYDAHNRPVRKEYTVPAGVIATPAVVYCYDGEGRRVKRTAVGQTTVYVYNATGELAAADRRRATGRVGPRSTGWDDGPAA
jgi:hypothetical protein